MPTTTNLALPYPALSSAPNVPQDIQNLATTLDTKLGAQVRNPPCVLVTKATATITNTTITTINWTAAPKNDFSMWSAGTPSILTIPYSGLWLAQYVVRWASQATAAGLRQARLDLGGAEQMVVYMPTTSALNATNIPIFLTMPIVLTAGDQISTSVFQSSGGSLDIVGSTRLLLTMISS